MLSGIGSITWRETRITKSTFHYCSNGNELRNENGMRCSTQRWVSHNVPPLRICLSRLVKALGGVCLPPLLMFLLLSCCVDFNGGMDGGMEWKRTLSQWGLAPLPPPFLTTAAYPLCTAYLGPVRWRKIYVKKKVQEFRWHDVKNASLVFSSFMHSIRTYSTGH